MKIEGAFDVAAPREAVYRYITDPGLMARCVPGCEEIEPLDSMRYRARVLVAMANLNVRFNLVVQVTQEEPPVRVLSQTRGEEGSRASILAAENSVTLVTLDDTGTRVQYASEVSITGRLGKFALGVMKKKVESLGQEFAGRFRAQLEERLRAAESAAAAALQVPDVVPQPPAAESAPPGRPPGEADEPTPVPPRDG